MSYKFYNVLIAKNTSLNEVFSKLQSIKQPCVDKAYEGIKKHFLVEKMISIDLKENFLLLNSENVIEEFSPIKVMDDISNAKKKVLQDGVRDVFLDFTFEIGLVPYKNDVLIFYFAENLLNFYSEQLESLGFEDFHWQNSTDKPDNITEEEWEYRERVFTESGCKKESVSQLGLSMQIVDWNDYDFVWNDLNITDPNLFIEERKSELADLLLSFEWFTTNDSNTISGFIRYQKKHKKNRLKYIILSKNFD